MGVLLWNVSTGECESTGVPEIVDAEKIVGMQFSLHGQLLVVIDSNSDICVWHVHKIKVVAQLSCGVDRIDYGDQPLETVVFSRPKSGVILFIPIFLNPFRVHVFSVCHSCRISLRRTYSFGKESLAHTAAFAEDGNLLALAFSNINRSTGEY